MKNPWIKALLPHVIAIVIFWLASAIYCKPVFEGNVLNQHDIVGFQGAAQNSFDYKEKHGQLPAWNTGLFSGMPNYFITGVHGKSILPNVAKVFGLGLPEPANLFFIAALCFYILMLALGINPIVSVLTALAYALSTYNPIFISAGHITKMYAIGFLPLPLAGAVFASNKKYWLGLAITTIGSYLLVSSNHHQITYYFALLLGIVSLFFLVGWIKTGQSKHAAIALGIVAISFGVGVAGSSLYLLTQSENSKATMRGGKSLDIKGDTVIAANTKGLDKDYAFSYSVRPAESVVMFMPKAFGVSSGTPLREDNKVIEKLIAQGVPENAAMQVGQSLPAYWGGMAVPGESTAGPFYLGAIIFILGLLGFVFVPGKIKWGLLTTAVLALFLSWGKYFPAFNNIMYSSFPMYNKFRVPSMAVVLLQLSMPIMAALFMNKLVAFGGKEAFSNQFKKALYTLGGVAALIVILYFITDYTSGYDSEIRSSIAQQAGNEAVGNAVIAGLKAERASMFGGQLIRTFGYLALVLGVLFLFMKNFLKPIVAIAIFGAISIIDLWLFDKKFLNEESFKPKDEVASQNFPKSPVDEQLLQDKSPHYRVFNTSADRFNENNTSYYHRSIGGYHAAKLRIYQDVIQSYLSEKPNQQILNALDAKYMIFADPQSGKQSLLPNNEAYGAAWFVKHAIPATDDVDAFKAIGKTNLKDTAIVQGSPAFNAGMDTSARISLKSYDNDKIEYSTTSTSPQFAVFSEVYYPYGWNAYIDGKKVDYVKTNYFMRGLSIPSGAHEIGFVFEPESIKKGTSISFIASIFIALFTLGGLFMAWWTTRNQATT